MKAFTKLLLLPISVFFIFIYISKSAPEIFFAPYDSSKVEGIFPELAMPNSEGGFLILGTVYPKPLVQYEYNPEGIFIMNLVPDNNSNYKISFYTEYFLPKPITIGNRWSNAYYKEDGNIVIITSWNKYFTQGGFGTSAIPIPYVIEFDSHGKFISAFVDSLTDRRNNSMFAPFTPSLMNDDKSFTLFNEAAPDSIKFLFASKYDKNGNLLERIPITSMRRDGKDSLEKEENKDGGWYEPISVIKDDAGNIYLNTDKIRTFTGTIVRKKSSYIFKIDKNLKIVEQIDFSFFDLDGPKHKVRTLIDEMFINKNNDLVVFGRHGLMNSEVKSGYNNKFVYILNTADFSIKTKKEWKDTLYDYNQIKENSEGGYLIAGSEKNQYSSEYYTMDNQKNYAVMKMDKDFNIIGVYTNNDKTNYNDYLTIALEPKNGNYEFFGNLNRKALLLRLQDSDFITDVNDSELTEEISIFPNPAGDFITLDLKPSEGFKPSEGSAISIFNTLGEKVLSASARLAVPLRINISALPRGMYLIKAGGETAKFMKM